MEESSAEQLEEDFVAIGPGAVAVPPGVIMEYPTRVLASIPRCEAVALGPDGNLFAANEAGELFRISPEDGRFEVVANLGGWGVGLCVDGDGLVYVCVIDKHKIVRANPENGEVVDYCTGVEGGPLPSPNYCAFGEDGTLYVTDSRGPGKEEREGRLVAIPVGGGEGTTVPGERLYYANGMAVRKDGTLFVIDTFVEPRVVTIKDSKVETYVELPGTVPDGLAFDDDGGLMISCFQPNRLLRVDHEGAEARIIIDDWTGQLLLSPTNIAFFGPERKSLAFASLLGWWLSAIDTPWVGQPLFYPRPSS
jgi:sugar lactone lactonase YvrE